MRNHIRQVGVQLLRNSAHEQMAKEMKAAQDKRTPPKPTLSRKQRQKNEAFSRRLSRRNERAGLNANVEVLPDGGIHVTVKGDKKEEGVLDPGRTGRHSSAAPTPDGQIIADIEAAVQTLTSRPNCRACGASLLPPSSGIADGCPCNAPRGVNHGLVEKYSCTCDICDPAQTGSTRPAEGA